MKSLVKANVLKTNGLIVALIMLVAFSACDKKNGSTAPGSSLSMKVDMSAFAKTAADTVILSSAKVLLKNIKFKTDVEDSLDYKVGPFIVNLDMNGGVTQIAATDIPNGIYDEIKFKIHKPEDDEAVSDTDFVAGASSDQRFSVVIRGTYNGTPFLYRSKKDIEQELEINPPLVVTDSTNDVNATMLVAPAGWFMKDGLYLDPMNESNRSDIDDNIKKSFKKAMKDNDHDGEENDDDDDQDEDDNH
ncbi:hypothetical protein F9K33_14220 [bacterium]|nr:MAG: hypothetical protein F9K33_14220 [bacterium]